MSGNHSKDARTYALETIKKLNRQGQQETSELRNLEREPRGSSFSRSLNQKVRFSLDLTVEASVDQLEKECSYLNTLQQKQIESCKTLVRNLESQLNLLENFDPRQSQRTSGDWLDSTLLPEFPKEELEELKTQAERLEIHSRDNF